MDSRSLFNARLMSINSGVPGERMRGDRRGHPGLSPSWPTGLPVVVSSFKSKSRASPPAVPDACGLAGGKP